jgi:Ni/Fe-hydrogenase subunit HybB-like protein
MSKAKPLGGRIFTLTFLICLILSGFAIYFTAKRFMFGIGSVANLNDGYPWGIWIAYDVVVGTALACGGYVMALMVYPISATGTACLDVWLHPGWCFRVHRYWSLF